LKWLMLILQDSSTNAEKNEGRGIKNLGSEPLRYLNSGDSALNSGVPAFSISKKAIVSVG